MTLWYIYIGYQSGICQYKKETLQAHICYSLMEIEPYLMLHFF